MNVHSTRTKAGRTRRLALVSSLLLVSAALVGSLGVSSATADDTTPSPDSGASADPSDPASGESPSADPSSPTPSPTPSPASTPSSSPTPGSTSATPPATSGKVDGNYNPHDGVIFNYPYSDRTDQDTIRTNVDQLVRSIPTGGHLRIAMYSVNDDELVDDLIAASRRGVSVQVIVNSHNVHGTPGHSSSPSFIRLRNTLGSARGYDKDPYRESWADYCVHSCRGTGGDVHYKMILADKVRKTNHDLATFVTMMGSPNLTMLAARGQWNHLNTYVDQVPGHPTFSAYYDQFKEMALDRPANPEYRNYTLKYFHDRTGSDAAYGVPTWFFPKPGANTAGEDPSYTTLDPVICTGRTDSRFNINGRTVIRIGAYAWYDDRGVWMAKRIRALWNAGCNVEVETAVMGNTVKSILYSPAGRGRIPIKRVATYSSNGTVLTYDHAKWISVSGNYDHKKSIHIFTGTQNWSNLALSSDDATQTYAYTLGGNDRFGVVDMYKAYIANFDRIWTGPHASYASPKSYVPGDIGGPNATLGQGKYVNVQND